MRIMPISRYPLKLSKNPNTKSMTEPELVPEVERVSPNIKRIIERVGDSNYIYIYIYIYIYMHIYALSTPRISETINFILL